MEKYLLFGGQYEKIGGWGDFKKSFDSIQKCRNYAKHNFYHWYQIVNTTTGAMIDNQYDCRRYKSKALQG